MSRKEKKLEKFSKNDQDKYDDADFDDNRKKKKKIREQVRNANRVLKKGKRQELKRELNKKLKELNIK